MLITLDHKIIGIGIKRIHMKISIFALSLLSLLSSAAEYEGVISFGQQFGDVLGGQFFYNTESSKYYVFLGYVGAYKGFQTRFSENYKQPVLLTL